MTTLTMPESDVQTAREPLRTPFPQFFWLRPALVLIGLLAVFAGMWWWSRRLHDAETEQTEQEDQPCKN